MSYPAAIFARSVITILKLVVVLSIEYILIIEACVDEFPIPWLINILGALENKLLGNVIEIVLTYIVNPPYDCVVDEKKVVETLTLTDPTYHFKLDAIWILLFRASACALASK